MIYEPCLFKRFVMPCVILGKNFSIAKKRKMKQKKKQKGFMCPKAIVRLLACEIAPMKSESSSKEMTKLLQFYDVYHTDSFLK